MNLSALPRVLAFSVAVQRGPLAVHAFPVFIKRKKKKKKKKEKEKKKKKKKPVNVASCVCNAYFLLFPLRLVMSLSLFRNGC